MFDHIFPPLAVMGVCLAAVELSSSGRECSVYTGAAAGLPHQHAEHISLTVYTGKSSSKAKAFSSRAHSFTCARCEALGTQAKAQMPTSALAMLKHYPNHPRASTLWGWKKSRHIVRPEKPPDSLISVVT